MCVFRIADMKMYWICILLYLVGLPLTFTYDNLSHNKVASQTLTYTPPYTGASNAVDGNTKTCTKQFAIGLNAPYKTVWWKVDLGGVYNIYSITISFKTYDVYEKRQRGRFAGFSLYVSTTGEMKSSTVCYQDGPQLPPLNFTTTCIEHGRYVIFYNERIDGVPYPKDYEITAVFNELCEVVVLGCNKPGVYGNNCAIPCSINCKDNSCNIENGSCFGCKPGWREKHCDKECREGWYGVNCSQQCVRHCRDGTSCNHVTGQCDRGCDAGWTGMICNQECNDGTYGYDCGNNCSSHCLDGSPCNKHTGQCDMGCSPGYSNDDCTKDCPHGQFGLGCKNRCSEQCMNKEPCDHVSGYCKSGCLDGFVGTHCNNSCQEGYFGSNCSQVCSPSCKSDTCRHTDGWCNTCAADDNCYTDSLSPKQESLCSSIWIVGFSLSLGVNGIFIFCTVALCRGIVKKNVRFSGNLLSFSKESVIYTDSDLTNAETSTYQELNVSSFTIEPSYQNTIIR